ncbi:MAG TPA: hypothetical protein VGB98_26555 [Pyrinomonadaceae bacterium]|jgi:hypothetical protein
MDWIDEMKEQKRLAEAKRAAQEEMVREEKKREEARKKKYYLKHKPKIDLKVQALEDYAKRLNLASHRAKDNTEISFSSGDRSLHFRFSGDAVEVCFGIAGDYEAQLHGKSGKLSMPVDRLTVDKFSPWFQWLVGWKGKRPPVWLFEPGDKEVFQLLGLAMLALTTIIVLCVLYFKYLS